MASRAVSRSWWSYLSNLSKKSNASGDTRCWFSPCTKRSHRLRLCLKIKSSPSSVYTTTVKLPTCQVCRWNEGPAQSGICPDIHIILPYQVLWRYGPTKNPITVLVIKMATGHSINYLIVVVVAVEEGFFPKYHAGEHTTQTPHI